MPHLSSIFLLVILFAGSATAGDALYDELMADPAKAKVMRKGIKILEEYFKSDLGAMESGSKGTRALKKLSGRWQAAAQCVGARNQRHLLRELSSSLCARPDPALIEAEECIGSQV